MKILLKNMQMFAFPSTAYCKKIEKKKFNITDSHTKACLLVHNLNFTGFSH